MIGCGVVSLEEMLRDVSSQDPRDAKSQGKIEIKRKNVRRQKGYSVGFESFFSQELYISISERIIIITRLVELVRKSGIDLSKGHLAGLMGDYTDYTSNNCASSTECQF